MRKKLLTLTCIVSLAISGHAQEKCAAARMHAKALENNPALAAKAQEIEAFTKEWIAAHQGSARAAAVTIPVVVHVVHRGEAVGTGQNISDAQIQSQFTAANLDFSNTNPDSAVTSLAFYPVVGNTNIQFCLAQRDPNGAATNGINRIDGLSRFGVGDWANGTQVDTLLKPATIWDPTKYLNVWILQFDPSGDDSTTLGYATFPTDHGTNRDGLVFRYRAFGTVGDSLSSSNSRGRTFTHEVGHYLNLSHIWGDQNCGSDSVADTPPQVNKHYGCPTFPTGANNTCGSDANGEMFMNYMDYVDDNCMYMFTKGQGARILAALNGPRASLLSSQGCQAPSGIASVDALKLSVYPNPTNGSIHITTAQTIKNGVVELYNAMGQRVLSESYPNTVSEMTLNVSSLPEGIYTLSLSDLKTKSFTKVILNK